MLHEQAIGGSTPVRTIWSCTLCAKDYLRWQASDNGAVCTNWQPLNCKQIDNCLTTVCFDNTTGKAYGAATSYSYGCRMCQKNYTGSSWDTVNGAGSTKCTSGMTISNCEYMMQTSASTQVCYSCKSNFAVSNDSQSCVAYTADGNCRSLQPGNTQCHYCWHSYYWDSTTCKLGGN